MELQAVTSSLIDAVGFNVDESQLLVQFKGKSDVYSYGNISPELYEEMMGAESVGGFFSRNIKPFKERYPYAKLPFEQFLQNGGTWVGLDMRDRINGLSENGNGHAVDFTPTGPVPAVIAEPDVPADPEELKKEALALSDKAKAIEIRDPDAYTLAATTLLAIAWMRGGLEKTFRPEIDRTHKLHAAACAVLNHYDKPLAADEERLKDGMRDFKQREEQKRLSAERVARAEQERQAEADAKHRAEELQLADAIAAEERGEPEIAKMIIEAPPLPVAPAYVPPVSYQSTVPKIKGISHVEDWTFEIEKLDLLPREWLIPDEEGLAKHAKNLKGRALVPGVRFFNRGGVRSAKKS